MSQEEVIASLHEIGVLEGPRRLFDTPADQKGGFGERAAVDGDYLRQQLCELTYSEHVSRKNDQSKRRLEDVRYALKMYYQNYAETFTEDASTPRPEDGVVSMEVDDFNDSVLVIDEDDEDDDDDDDDDEDEDDDDEDDDDEDNDEDDEDVSDDEEMEFGGEDNSLSSSIGNRSIFSNRPFTSVMRGDELFGRLLGRFEGRSLDEQLDQGSSGLDKERTEALRNLLEATDAYVDKVKEGVEQSLEEVFADLLSLVSQLPRWSLSRQNVEGVEKFLAVATLQVDAMEVESERVSLLSILLGISVHQMSLEGCLFVMMCIRKYKLESQVFPEAKKHLNMVAQYLDHHRMLSLFDSAYLSFQVYEWTSGRASERGKSGRFSHHASSITTDGTYLYVLNGKGLYKMGTGNGGSLDMHIYQYQSQVTTNLFSAVVWCGGRLFVHRRSDSPFELLEFDTNLLVVKKGEAVAVKERSYTKCRYCSDGRRLYIVWYDFQGEPTVQVDVYELGNAVKLVSSVMLDCAVKDTPRHKRCVCDGCERYSFEGLRYRCTKCADFDLCQACFDMGVCHGRHTREHFDSMKCMEPSQSTGRPVRDICFLQEDAFRRGYILVDGEQISVVVPPSVSPNTSSKYTCIHVFELATGKNKGYFMPTVSHPGSSGCYDALNGLIFAHIPENQSILSWKSYGPVPVHAPRHWSQRTFLGLLAPSEEASLSGSAVYDGLLALLDIALDRYTHPNTNSLLLRMANGLLPYASAGKTLDPILGSFEALLLDAEAKGNTELVVSERLLRLFYILMGLSSGIMRETLEGVSVEIGSRVGTLVYEIALKMGSDVGYQAAAMGMELVSGQSWKVLDGVLQEVAKVLSDEASRPATSSMLDTVFTVLSTHVRRGHVDLPLSLPESVVPPAFRIECHEGGTMLHIVHMLIAFEKRVGSMHADAPSGAVRLLQALQRRWMAVVSYGESRAWVGFWEVYVGAILESSADNMRGEWADTEFYFFRMVFRPLLAWLQGDPQRVSPTIMGSLLSILTNMGQCERMHAAGRRIVADEIALVLSSTVTPRASPADSRPASQFFQRTIFANAVVLEESHVPHYVQNFVAGELVCKALEDLAVRNLRLPLPDYVMEEVMVLERKIYCVTLTLLGMMDEETLFQPSDQHLQLFRLIQRLRTWLLQEQQARMRELAEGVDVDTGKEEVYRSILDQVEAASNILLRLRVAVPGFYVPTEEGESLVGELLSVVQLGLTKGELEAELTLRNDALERLKSFFELVAVSLEGVHSSLPLTEFILFRISRYGHSMDGLFPCSAGLYVNITKMFKDVLEASLRVLNADTDPTLTPFLEHTLRAVAYCFGTVEMADLAVCQSNLGSRLIGAISNKVEENNLGDGLLKILLTLFCAITKSSIQVYERSPQLASTVERMLADELTFISYVTKGSLALEAADAAIVGHAVLEARIYLCLCVLRDMCALPALAVALTKGEALAQLVHCGLRTSSVRNLGVLLDIVLVVCPAEGVWQRVVDMSMERMGELVLVEPVLNERSLEGNVEAFEDELESMDSGSFALIVTQPAGMEVVDVLKQIKSLPIGDILPERGEIERQLSHAGECLLIEHSVASVCKQLGSLLAGRGICSRVTSYRDTRSIHWVDEHASHQMQDAAYTYAVASEITAFLRRGSRQSPLCLTAVRRRVQYMITQTICVEEDLKQQAEKRRLLAALGWFVGVGEDVIRPGARVQIHGQSGEVVRYYGNSAAWVKLDAKPGVVEVEVEMISTMLPSPLPGVALELNVNHALLCVDILRRMDMKSDDPEDMTMIVSLLLIVGAVLADEQAAKQAFSGAKGNAILEGLLECSASSEALFEAFPVEPTVSSALRQLYMTQKVHRKQRQQVLPWRTDLAWGCVFSGNCWTEVAHVSSRCASYVVGQDIPLGDTSFYFEVRIVSGDKVGVGLMPKTNLPGWGNSCYAYKSSGQKVAPTIYDADVQLYACPFGCGQGGLDMKSLMIHMIKRHSHSSQSVHCPFCTTGPFGSNAYAGSLFFSHLEGTHRTNVTNIMTSQPTDYGAPYRAGDIVGCGWSKEDGAVYFTLNGASQGVAFIDVSENVVPAVHLEGHGVAIQGRFQPAEWKVDVVKMQPPAEAIEAARREQERVRNQAEQTRLDAEALLLEQAKFLQEFVNLPVEYCKVCLLKTGMDMEAAASYAFDHYDAWTNEQAEALLRNGGVVHDTEMSVVQAASNDYDGHAYSFDAVAEVRALERSVKGSRVMTSELKPGCRVRVTEKAEDLEFVVKEGLVHAHGTVVRVNMGNLQVLVRFHDSIRSLYAKYWLPLEALVVKRGETYTDTVGGDSVPYAYVLRHYGLAVAHETISRSIHQLDLSHTLRGSSVGTQWLSLVRVSIRRHMKEPLFGTGHVGELKGVKKLLELQMGDDCRRIKGELLAEARELSIRIIDKMKAGQEKVESRHPLEPSAFDVEIHKPGSTALVVTFDGKSALSSHDELAIYESKAKLSPLFHVSAGPIHHFHPTLLMVSKAVMQVNLCSGGSDAPWGFLARFTPVYPDFNVAVWLIQTAVELAPQSPVILAEVADLMGVLLERAVGLPGMVRSALIRLMRLAIQLQNAGGYGEGGVGYPSIEEDVERAIVAMEGSQDKEGEQRAIAGLPSRTIQDGAELTVHLRAQGKGGSQYTYAEVPIASANPLEALQKMHYLLTFIDAGGELPYQCLLVDGQYDFPEEIEPMPFLEGNKLSNQLRDILCEVYWRIVGCKGSIGMEDVQMLWKSGMERVVSEHKVVVDRALTIDEFLDESYTLFATSPNTIHDCLQRVGYSELYELGKEAIQVWMRSRIWKEVDGALVAVLNELAEVRDEAPTAVSLQDIRLVPHQGLGKHVTPIEVDSMAAGLSMRFPKLACIPHQILEMRACILQLFNRVVEKSIALVDLSGNHELQVGEQLVRNKHLVFYKVKVDYLRLILHFTTSDTELPNVTLRRIDLADSERDTMEDSIFGQIYEQMRQVDPMQLRKEERAFRVNLEGEQVEGEVGPYQEALSQVSAELQPRVGEESKPPGLFIPSPNMSLAGENIGIGEARDRYIPVASKDGPEDLQMYEFVGVLIGVSIRTRSILSLSLASLFWKPLVGEAIDVEDVKRIDFSSIDSLHKLQDMDATSFAELVFLSFTCQRSDGSVVELVPGGSNVDVTWEQLTTYIKQFEAERIHETDAQTAAIAKGLAKVVPLEVLRLFTWEDMELLVCGHSEINLEMLRRNTRYRGDVTEDDARVKWLWEILEGFNQYERALFLRFACGRQRLPPEDLLRLEPMKVFPANDEGDPDQRLPSAETCWFNIKLPRYSSKEVMRERLLFAISHTRTIDADEEEGGDTQLFDGPISFSMLPLRSRMEMLRAVQSMGHDARNLEDIEELLNAGLLRLVGI